MALLSSRADACIFVMNLSDEKFKPLLAADRNDGIPPLLNLGSNIDLTIAELASLVKEVVGYKGEIMFDVTKPDGTIRKLMDSSLLNQIGWKPKVMLKEGLQAVYDNYEQF